MEDRSARAQRRRHGRHWELLQEKGVKLRSLVEQIDPDTPNGRLMLNFMAVLAEHERQLNSERTKAGMAAARARGVKFGRKGPDAKTIAAKLATAKSMLAQNPSAKEPPRRSAGPAPPSTAISASRRRCGAGE